MRIEALVFDIGNVLVLFDWQPFKSRLQAECANLTPETEKEFRELVVRFDVGEMTGEMFARVAIRTIGFPGDEPEFIAIWNGIFSSNPPMERTILALKERFPQISYYSYDPIDFEEHAAAVMALFGPDISLTPDFGGADIIVSLDGDEALHDRIRNIPGAFRKLEEGVQSKTRPNRWKRWGAAHCRGNGTPNPPCREYEPHGQFVVRRPHREAPLNAA